MPEQKIFQIFELLDREISSKGGLFSFFAFNTYTNVRDLDHSNVVSSVTDSASHFSGVFFNFLGEHSFLKRRTPTANNSRCLRGCLKELVLCRLYLRRLSNSLPIYNQHSLSLILLLIKLLQFIHDSLHIFKTFHHIHILVIGFDTSWDTNTSCSFDFISSKHPNSNSSLTNRFQSWSNIFL